jgi:hypothetical protein
MIYVIQAGLVGPFKIGYAREPQKRLGQLQTGNSEQLKLIKVVRGDRSLEKKIHRDLVAFRKQGEWFALTEDVISYISRLGVVDYELEDGTARAVLWREEVDGATEPCPFCNLRHFHGFNDGVRFPHCTAPKPFVVARDGTKLQHSEGYLVRTRTAITSSNHKLIPQQESVARFLTECCVVQQRDEYFERSMRVDNSDLYLAYATFCKATRRPCVSHRLLSRYLKKIGLRQLNSGGRYWEGIRIRTP